METNPPQIDPDNVSSVSDVGPESTVSDVGPESTSEASGAPDELAFAPAEATDGDEDEELPEADGETPPFLEFLDDWEKETEPGK
jgi:hypothetical protein